MSLKTRTALAVSTLFVLASAVIAFWALTLFEAEKKTSLAADSFTIVSNIADDLDAKLRMSHKALIAVAAVVPPTALADFENSEAFLERQVALHALFDNGLFLVAPDGRLIGESPPRPQRRGSDVSQREYFHKTLETRKPYISKPYRSTHKPGQPALIMTAPVFDPGGQLIGLLYGSLDLLGSNILTDLAQRRIGRSGYIYLADGRENMIVHPDPSRIMKPTAAPGENRVFDRAIEGWEGTDETVNSKGVHGLLSVKHLQTTGWIVGVNLPTAEFYEPIRQAQRYFLWSTMVGTLLMLVLVWLLVRHLMRPLLSMTQQVNVMLAEPATNTRLKINSSDEIGVLGKALNLTLDRLSRQRDHLEQEVSIRTADLVLARDAAEAANKAKSAFLATMSHELRTPLNAVLGFSSLMRQDKTLTEAQDKNLAIINRSGEHLLTLINDVLEIAKIEAGKTQLLAAPFDLAALVHEVTDMMEGRAHAKGLQLIFDQSSAFPRYVFGDAARLRQILINLVGNAVKFTEQGGVTLRLCTRPGAVAHVVFEIEDSGPGISLQDQQRLFQPFMQLGKQAGDNTGTGLGLAITRQFVQLMEGSIKVESTLGAGSLFRVELPLPEARESDIARPDPSAPGEVAGLVAGQARYRILIAEDHTENQLLLTELMQRIGFETRLAGDGEHAIALFQSWQPDLIFMDWRMPLMDGVQATRAIRKLPGGQAVKIVAVTASAFAEERAEMLAVGMDDFVRKPYRASEIYAQLGKHLGVQYRYAERPHPKAEISDATLGAESLTVLPGALRSQLRRALESLNSESIQAALREVKAHDAALHQILSRLIEDFDYPAILKVL